MSKAATPKASYEHLDESLHQWQRDLLDRKDWERKNRHDFEEDFRRTQKDGCGEYGMLFIHAQEAALGAAFGGLFAAYDPGDWAVKAMFSRTVLAVLRAANPKPATDVGS